MACGRAIAGFQDIDDLFGSPMAVANVDQGPDEDTDHVAQKAVPFDVDGERVGITIEAARDVAPKDGPHRILVLVHGGGKGTEIPRPDEVLGRYIHRLHRQRPRDVPTEANLADRTELAGIDRVPVATGPELNLMCIEATRYAKLEERRMISHNASEGCYSPEICLLALGQEVLHSEASIAAHDNGECVSGVSGSQTIAGHSTVHSGTRERHAAPKEASIESKRRRRKYGGMPVGPGHSRVTDGVMPIQSCRFGTLEGPGSRTQRDEPRNHIGQLMDIGHEGVILTRKEFRSLTRKSYECCSPTG